MSEETDRDARYRAWQAACERESEELWAESERRINVTIASLSDEQIASVLARYPLARRWIRHPRIDAIRARWLRN